MSPPVSEPHVTHGRLALVLAAATGVAAMLVIPYATALSGTPMHTRGLPPALVVVLSGVQSMLLAFALGWAGLRLGATLDLGAPLLRAWMERRASQRRTRWALAAVVGVAVGLAIIALDVLVIHRVSPEAGASIRAAVQTHHAARWKGALASFYGGIAEEVFLRLFLMTALAWIIAKLTRSRVSAVFLTANVVAALSFGAGHLPVAAKVFGALTSAIVIRTIALNAIAGVAYGELYRRYGLEHAMVAHFCTDIVLHVIIGG